MVWVEYLDIPAYERVKIMDIDGEKRDWVDEMKDFIEHDTLPSDFEQPQLCKKRSPRYTVDAGTLYRRSFNQPLLRCVPLRLVKIILDEVRKGACRGHPSAGTVADKVISNGYYWSRLRKNTTKYVRRCDKCQRFLDVPRLSSVPQTPIVTTWSFDMWGLDLIGGLIPAVGGTDHLVVAVDYFTKWIDARPLKRITKRKTMKLCRTSHDTDLGFLGGWYQITVDYFHGNMS